MARDFEEARRRYDYDPATGIFTRRVASGRFPVRSVAGTKPVAGRYGKIVLGGRKYIPTHRLAWLWMTGKWPERLIDHVNGEKSDNRWANLREASSSQNSANRSMRSNNTSGFKGVSLQRSTGKWLAHIRVEGRSRHLGVFQTKRAAHEAYVVAAQSAFGEFSNRGL